MIVFKYVQDKDVFEQFYSSRLAVRIVQKLSANDDAEASMISRLKQACGYEYTRKLQNMINDIGLSKDLETNFKRHLSTTDEPVLGVEFHSQVLSSGSWPFKQAFTFKLPILLANCLERYNMFYLKQHSGRKLTWLNSPQMSKGELVTNCFNSRYTFQVSLIQMSILLYYNNAIAYTYLQLKEFLNITKEEYLIHALKVLISAKLLQLTHVEEESKDGGTNDFTLNDYSTISLYEGYRNKRLRVSLNVPMKKEEKAETEKTHHHISRNRKHETEACIVRIMKDKKIMPYSALVAAVIDQLKSRFTPQIANIKKNIESLIERDYIERDPKDPKSYRYIA